MKRIGSLILIGLLLVTLTACEQKLDPGKDAIRFKQEYEALNGEENGNGKNYRVVEIDENNPFVYATTDEIVEKINNKESFVVYFGFAKCPWCRSMIEQLVKSAEDNKIDKIYYVDVFDVRDTYKLDEEGNIHKTFDGTPGYNTLLPLIENVLSDYTLTNDEGEKVEVGEKRIYAPNVVAIVKGKAEKMVEGTSEKLEDPYDQLTEEMKKESYDSFKCLWECLSEGANVCRKNAC